MQLAYSWWWLLGLILFVLAGVFLCIWGAKRQKRLSVKKEEKLRDDKTQKIPSIPPIKEEIFTTGEPKLGIIACTDDINPMIDKMNATLKRREEKKGSLIVDNPIINKVGDLMEVDFNEQHYSFEGKGTEEEFKEWFLGYFKKALSCVTCGRIIFPDEAVGECNKGVMHMNYDCCPSGGFFVGHIDDEGKIIPYHKD